MGNNSAYACILHQHVRTAFANWSSLGLLLCLNLSTDLRAWLNFDLDLLNKANSKTNACNAELVWAL